MFYRQIDRIVSPRYVRARRRFNYRPRTVMGINEWRFHNQREYETNDAVLYLRFSFFSLFFVRSYPTGIRADNYADKYNQFVVIALAS